MRAIGLTLVGAVLVAVAASAPVTASRPVTYLPAREVATAFAKGRPLVEVENYKVHASRRDGIAGQAEVHEADTDIIYVLTGTAVLVTGGSVVDPKTTAPEEIRGPRIAGGETRALQPGDFVIVPTGTPHWFKEVPGPFTYYVVKVRAEAGR
jgi:mannose-6-phosphate isomerase-like protein (cupin superfamily)